MCFYEHGYFEDIAAIAVADILRSPLFLGLWAFCGCRCFAFAAALAAIGAFCVYNKETRGETRVCAAGLRSGEPLFFEKKRPTRGFQNFSMECSIFVHKKAKMPGYTRSIETKGGKNL